ncbi:MAG TPA: T9SS type A sorting domain-containing protein [Saprospiraceae bacterium]|nr:T9SS type A sorting domain-containing protein [Saprospiraceae bacterium]
MSRYLIKPFLFLFLLFITFNVLHATTVTVGTGKMYATPNALYLANVLNDGDTILIDPQTFTGNASLAAWSRNNLVIVGVGTQKTKLVANGSYILGKGIWVFIGNNITVENIEFSGATVPDENGAGIRLDGSGMTARRCYFHGNENGILTSNPGTGDILIEYSEFDNNGFGDGQSHNLYIGRINKLTFRYNYTHHAKIGHNLKTRAKENYIEYNRIMDEDTGTSSYLIDMSNGGVAVLKGNLLMQGINTDNCNLISFGSEGFPAGYQKVLYVINNTFVNRRSPGCNFLNISTQATSVSAYNNVFAGLGSIAGSFPASLGGNLVQSNIANVGLANEAGFDYALLSNSPAINIGVSVPAVSGLDFTIDKSYVHPFSYSSRVSNGLIDAGAYEYQSVLAISDEDEQTELLENPSRLLCFPNPTEGLIQISYEKQQVEYLKIINVMGQVLVENTKTNSIDLSNQSSGIYYLMVKLYKRDLRVFSILKL